MLKRLVFALAVVAMASYAGARTLTADGFTAQGVAVTPVQHDRIGLVNDGSFEFGECELGSAWTCTSNTNCAWILDPIDVWGYPAYDGTLCAWLGGFCDTPNSNSFCQDLYINPYEWALEWYWMGYVNSACGTVSVTVDGNTIWSHVMQMSEHTYGSWNSSWTYGWLPLLGYYPGGNRTLCFEWEACPDGISNDNMLIDYVTFVGLLGAADVSLSTVKALY